MRTTFKVFLVAVATVLGCFLAVVADLAFWMWYGSYETDPSAGGAFCAAFILTASVAAVIGGFISALLAAFTIHTLTGD